MSKKPNEHKKEILPNYSVTEEVTNIKYTIKKFLELFRDIFSADACVLYLINEEMDPDEKKEILNERIKEMLAAYENEREKAKNLSNKKDPFIDEKDLILPRDLGEPKEKDVEILKFIDVSQKKNEEGKDYWDYEYRNRPRKYVIFKKGKYEDDISENNVIFNEGLTAYTFRTKRLLANSKKKVPKHRASASLNSKHHIKPSSAMSIGFPLLYRGKAIGVITIEYYDQTKDYVIDVESYEFRVALSYLTSLSQLIIASKPQFNKGSYQTLFGGTGLLKLLKEMKDPLEESINERTYKDIINEKTYKDSINEIIIKDIIIEKNYKNIFNEIISKDIISEENYKDVIIEMIKDIINAKNYKDIVNEIINEDIISENNCKDIINEIINKDIISVNNFKDILNEIISKDTINEENYKGVLNEIISKDIINEENYKDILNEIISKDIFNGKIYKYLVNEITSKELINGNNYKDDINGIIKKIINRKNYKDVINEIISRDIINGKNYKDIINEIISRDIINGKNYKDVINEIISKDIINEKIFKDIINEIISKDIINGKNYRDIINEIINKDIINGNSYRDIINEIISRGIISEDNYRDIINEIISKDIISEDDYKDIINEIISKDIISEDNYKDIVIEMIKDIINKENYKDIINEMIGEDIINEKIYKDIIIEMIKGIIIEKNYEDVINEIISKDIISEDNYKDIVIEMIKDIINEDNYKDILSEIFSKDISNKKNYKDVINEIISKDVSNEKNRKDVINEILSKEIINGNDYKNIINEITSKYIFNEKIYKYLANEMISKELINGKIRKDIINEIISKDIFNEKVYKDNINEKIYKDTLHLFYVLERKEYVGYNEILDRVEGYANDISKYLGLTSEEKSFTDFLDKFKKHEELLLYGLNDFRDHFMHQFHVFVSGYIIINLVGFEFFRKAIGNSMKLALGREGEYLKISECDVLRIWFLVSFFHDHAYIFEKIDKELQQFLKDTFNQDLTVNFNWDELLKKNSKFPERLTNLQKFFCNKQRNTNPDALMRNYLDAIISSHDHGVLSALLLLKYLSEYEILSPKFGSMKDDCMNAASIKYDCLYAALAISIHNQYENLMEENTKRISFESFPIAFLLSYCDTAQSFGRIGKKQKYRTRFSDIKFLDNNRIIYELEYLDEIGEIPEHKDIEDWAKQAHNTFKSSKFVFEIKHYKVKEDNDKKQKYLKKRIYTLSYGSYRDTLNYKIKGIYGNYSLKSKGVCLSTEKGSGAFNDKCIEVICEKPIRIIERKFIKGVIFYKLCCNFGENEHCLVQNKFFDEKWTKNLLNKIEVSYDDHNLKYIQDYLRCSIFHLDEELSEK